MSVTESRAVKMITGRADPWPRIASSTWKPSISGSPMSKINRSNWPDSAYSKASRPSTATVVAWPAARRPLLTNAAIRGSSSAIKMAAISSSSVSAGSGMIMVKVEPRPASLTSWTVPWCASAMAETMASPRPAPVSPLPAGRPARANRSKIRRWSGSAMPTPSSRTQIRSAPSATAAPRAITAARLGEADGVRHQLDESLGDPLRVELDGLARRRLDQPRAVCDRLDLVQHGEQQIVDRERAPGVRSRVGGLWPAPSARRPAAASGPARRWPGRGS